MSFSPIICPTEVAPVQSEAEIAGRLIDQDVELRIARFRHEQGRTPLPEYGEILGRAAAFCVSEARQIHLEQLAGGLRRV